MSSPWTTDLPVSRTRFLFLDDAHLERTRNVRRNFHQLRRLREQPVLVPDRPTDQINTTIYGTVLRDTRDNTLVMWYHTQRFTRQGQIYRIAYARSRNGLDWEKPDLGVFEIDGSTAHNIVAQSHPIGQSPGINVIHCPDEPDAGKRFRRIYQGADGTFVAHSADGLHWTETQQESFRGSDAACVCYDALEKQFIAVTIQEPPIGRFPRRRTPAVATGADLQNWSAFQIAFACDETDDLLVTERLEKRRAVLSYALPEHYHEEINSMFCFNYADLVVGLPIMFDCCGYDEWKGRTGGPGSGKDDAVSHPQLAWCRDPERRRWQRPWREPFLPLSEPPQWDSGFIGLAEAPVRVGDELWFYYSGEDRSQQHPMFTLNHGWRYRQGELQGGIGVARLRLDGFASLDTDRQGGEVSTRPLRFDGDRILVNAVSYHGFRARVLDPENRPIPGFDFTDCRPVTGDSVCHELQFENADIAQLRGREVRLDFQLSGTMLFSVSFEP